MIEGTLDRTIGSTLNGRARDSARPHEPLVDFGTYAEGGYAERNVCDPAHPEHQELLAVLRDPIFAEPCVGLTALHGLRRRALSVEAAAV